MSLKSSNKVDTNVWELEVSVDGDTFKDAVTKAYLKQRKNITIPGFRKGKAPRFPASHAGYQHCAAGARVF